MTGADIQKRVLLACGSTAQGATLITGAAAYQASDLLMAHLAVTGRRLRLVCGDNHFNRYVICKQAKRAKVWPRVALSRIQISRSFNAFQFVESLKRLSPSADLTVVTGFVSMFFDEDMSHTEAARLFYEALYLTIECAATTRLILVSPSRIGQTRRGYFLTDLRAACELVFDAQQTESGTLVLRDITGARTGDRFISGQRDTLLTGGQSYGANIFTVLAGGRRAQGGVRQIPPRPARRRSTGV